MTPPEPARHADASPEALPEETPHGDALAALRWAVATCIEERGEDRAESEDTEAREVTPPGPLPPEAFTALPIATLREAFDAILLSKRPDDGLDALLAIGALDAILPEISVMVGFGDGEWKHKDVWAHTKQVVKQAVPRLEVRWGALLHDIGKPKTRRIDERGNVTFYGHSEVGARMFRRGVAARLGLEGELRERVHFLILHHLRPGQYKESWTDSAVRRFYKQMGDGLRDLLDLGRADITTKRPERRRRGVRQISLLKKRIDAIRDEDQKVRPLPKGLGTVIIAELGIAPSKELGDLIKRLEADVEAGRVEGGLEPSAYVAYLREHADEYGVPR